MAPTALALRTQFVAVELIRKSLTPLQVCLLRRMSPLKRDSTRRLADARHIDALNGASINIVYCFYRNNDVARGFSPTYVLRNAAADCGRRSRASKDGVFACSSHLT